MFVSPQKLEDYKRGVWRSSLTWSKGKGFGVVGLFCNSYGVEGGLREVQGRVE